ncbi:hypothetical protein [Paenibacillus donghaensis]|uniref:Uncharacterized protein n=1 Tax=Paenibacillus donghaensis TaxID=414771 RepID=A0A2Z2KJX3_9BACL|nr:hypothetical protein [Paenibacillus donghaensis]ASA24505.1 hypothetical protein B9T62_29390 [Paenibacillus donghaensis]
MAKVKGGLFLRNAQDLKIKGRLFLQNTRRRKIKGELFLRNAQNLRDYQIGMQHPPNLKAKIKKRPASLPDVK